MIRTQISLSEHERELLETAAERTGKSMSALIRDAVDLAYGEQRAAREDFLENLEQSFGAWKDRDFDGATYVARLRSGRRLREAYRR